VFSDSVRFKMFTALSRSNEGKRHNFQHKPGKSIPAKSFCRTVTPEILSNTSPILNARHMLVRKLFEALQSHGSFDLSRNYAIAGSAVSY